MSAKRKSVADDVNFEQAMQTLETLVGQLETGDLPLEESLKLYEQGIQLVAKCQKTLQQVEQKVAILSDKEQLIPYEGAQDD